MSQNLEIKPEFKTIRVLAPSYYKLVELTGMVNVLTGFNFSISQVASFLIENTYDSANSEFKKLLNKPAELQKIKTDVQKNLKDVLELLKDVKILE